MSDNRIISRSEYIVASVSGAAIDNKIMDVSTLYKKVQLLNSLKNESNN